MELEDMKAMWEAQDRKLDSILRLNSKLFEKANLDKADTALKRLFRGLLFEVVLNFGAVVLLGWFISDQLSEIRFLIPAVVLDVCVIALNIALIRQVVAIRDIDYDAPILVIQRKVELLKIQRIDALKWTLLSCPLLWVPLQIVSFQGLFGVDVYAFFGVDYLVANLLFGIAVIPLALWISKRYASRMKRTGLAQRLMGALAGSDLNAAIGFLNALARFEEAKNAN